MDARPAKSDELWSGGQIIQAVGSEPCAAARALFLEYADELGRDLCFQDFAHELATLPGAYAPPAGCLLLAHAGDQWAGCVALRPIAAGTCEMKRLYVRPAWRGQGLGRRLATEAVQRAGALGYQRMRLDTLASMHTARTLYHALGFREVVPYYHNPMGDVVFYELELPPAPLSP